MKLLLFRGSPRSNIPEVEIWNRENENECDVLYVRYAFEFNAYKFARDYFLDHKEYDYLLIATDDIIVKPEHIRQIIEDLKIRLSPENEEFRSFAVISGMMNVDQQEYDDQWGNLNVCYEIAMKDRKSRYYSWIKRNELPNDDIFAVKFAGFGLTAVRRDIIEKIPFHTDSVFKATGVESGASLDLVFCWYCHEYGIPIVVDQRIDMQHLRISGTHQAGERMKEIWLNDKMLQFGLNSI